MGEEIIDLGIAKIKLEKVEEKKIILIGKCPFCERKVRGTTHSQLDWNLCLHIKQKHSDDPEAEVLLKQLEATNRAVKKNYNK